MPVESVVPRTEEQLNLLIAERPRGWEYLLFAGALILELEQFESRYEDYKLEYAPRLGRSIYESEFPEYLKIQIEELEILGRNFTRMFNTEVAQAAFGPPGVEGDPARLLHLAKRYISIYDEFLRWVERLRGTAVPGEYSRLIAILARYADQPIEEIRRFVREYAESAGRVPEAIESGVPLQIEHLLTFSIPDELSAAFSNEVDRLKAER
jgi:hypothetical protein